MNPNFKFSDFSSSQYFFLIKFQVIGPSRFNKDNHFFFMNKKRNLLSKISIDSILVFFFIFFKRSNKKNIYLCESRDFDETLSGVSYVNILSSNQNWKSLKTLLSLMMVFITDEEKKGRNRIKVE